MPTVKPLNCAVKPEGTSRAESHRNWSAGTTAPPGVKVKLETWERSAVTLAVLMKDVQEPARVRVGVRVWVRARGWKVKLETY